MENANRNNYYHLFDVVNKNIAVYETNDSENFIFKDLNKFAEKTDKIKKEDVVGKNVIDIFPGVLKFGILEVFKRVYKTGIAENFPLRMYNDGRISGWRDNYIHKLPSGEIVAIYDDLTEMKKLEESLMESEKKFKSFFENNKAPILQINSKNQKIINCNNASIEYYGYTKEELTSKTIDQLNTLTKEEISIKMENAIKEKSNFFQFKHKLANGEIRDIELYASPIKIKNEIHLFSIIHDITDRIKSQKAYIENQRLSAIGEMTSSIAHDFNNSLQAISGNIELSIYENHNIPPELMKRLELIRSNIEETATRVKSLLKFSKDKTSITKKEKLNLNILIDELIIQTQPLWKTKADKNGINIKIIKDYKEELFVTGNKELLTSAIFNILKNSIEAMPKGGEIIFKIKKNSKSVCLSIKDTGIGMNEETKLRIFQPFFSTKGLELGKGLGMSSVYATINEHNGRIFVKSSKINKGTTIEINFPNLDKKHDVKKYNLKNNNNLDKKLKILWVDDDEIIASLAKGYLRALRHDGDIALSAKEALKLLEINNYDILVTDIGMPEMNGWQFIEKLRNELNNKDIKIIVLSGWQAEEDDLVNKYKINSVLQKPVSLNQLRKVLI